MIQALVYALLWLLSLFVAWKLGQADVLIAERDRMLDERGINGSAGAEDNMAPPSGSAGRAVTRSSSIYDGEVEAALDPRPLLSVIEGLEERPGLRVVEP